MYDMMRLLFILALLAFPLSYSYSYRSCRSYRQSQVMMAGGVVRGDKFPIILRIAEESKRGIIKDRSDEMKALLEAVALQNFEFMRRNAGKPRQIDGCWELLWTTEKETLFFAQYGLFGAKCTSISQTIDTTKNKIVNSIGFENDKEFTVNGDLFLNDDNQLRVNFKFSKAVLGLSSSLRLSVPPVGAGWFDNLYVNDRYRISRDIRGDWLLSRRV